MPRKQSARSKSDQELSNTIKNGHVFLNHPPQQQRAKRSVDEVDTSDKPNGVSAELMGRNYALLFATDDYDELKPPRFDRLYNPVFDAETIAADLRDIYGFDARVYKNQTLPQVLGIINEYVERQYAKEDQLLIFFAGHGTYDKQHDTGYLATKETKADDKYHISYLPYPVLIPFINSIKCNHIFLVIDACKSGAISRAIRSNAASPTGMSDATNAEDFDNGPGETMSVPVFIRRKLRVTSRWFLTSGSENRSVSDGEPGKHSPFAQKFIKALENKGDSKGYMEISNVWDYVKLVRPGPVKGNFAEDYGGDFFFIPKGSKLSFVNHGVRVRHSTFVAWEPINCCF